MNGTKGSQKTQKSALAAIHPTGIETDERKKRCSKCGFEKLFKEYSKAKKEKLGIKSACKSCLKKDSKIYYMKNQKDIGEKHAIYRNENRELISERRKEAYLNDKERFAMYSKKYYLENTEKAALTNKIYAANNRESINLNIKNRRSKDLEFRLDLNFRSIFDRVIRKNNMPKFSQHHCFLGCDIEFFIKYIESKFTEGMSWENYAHDTWHLDHIKPFASFDLTDITQYSSCFHYTNLQPLWAEDNYKKGAKHEKTPS